MALPGAMGITDIANATKTIYEQVTGQRTLTPTNEADIISLATTTLQTGADPMINAISQMVNRTIFSVRPYSRKFKGMEYSAAQYGNHVRKIVPIGTNILPTERYTSSAEAGIDMYKAPENEALQFNIYGQKVYDMPLKIYKDQLDSAVRNVEELGSLFQMWVTHASNNKEQVLEALSRNLLCNFIGGKNQMDADHVIHLLTEYNEVTGQQLTEAQVSLPENYTSFVQWAFGRIKTISDKLTERVTGNHWNVTGKEVLRHTPYEYQRLYLLSPRMNDIATRVFSNTFNDEYLKLMDYEAVNFWQNPDNEYAVKVTPAVLSTTGAIGTGTEQSLTNVFGVLSDVEAFGYNVFNNWSAVTPLNASGGYWVDWTHFTTRWFTDYTENGYVFLMD